MQDIHMLNMNRMQLIRDYTVSSRYPHS